MITLDEAIELLREKYAEVENAAFVNDAVAYALYHTWKKVDEENRRKKVK